MPRLLWLVYERLPHPDAVSYPAGEDDVRLAAELLALPYAKRLHLAEQLRNFLAAQSRRPVFARERVPCRRPSGLYGLVAWRFAKWLCAVLPAGESVAERTATRLHRWLLCDDATTLGVPLTTAVAAPPPPRTDPSRSHRPGSQTASRARPSRG